MRQRSNRPFRLPSATPWLAALALALIVPNPASAGKVAWLDEVVQEVLIEARAGGKAVGSEGATATRTAGRLFAREADEGLETLARRSDALARSAHRLETPSETLLQARFNRLIRPEPETARAFAALAPAEKRVVVEMGEAAQELARRYPGQAEAMVRKLGTEGLTAVRVYGDDVAEVVVKEGPEALGVLRKTGRGGWKFFNETVLPNKKKLVAAGLLAAFLADPDKFVDTAGRATEYAVRQFARAGVNLVGAVSAGRREGPGRLDRRRPGRLRPQRRRPPLPRHGRGRPGGPRLDDGPARPSRPLDAPARHVAAPDGFRPPEAAGPAGLNCNHANSALAIRSGPNS